MARFRFRLERVRQYQATVCTAEEAKLRDAMGALAGQDQALTALRSDFAVVAEGRNESAVFSTADLRAWSEFRHATARKERWIVAERLKASEAVEQQRAGLIKARQRLQMIDKLRDRALREHQVGVDRELEEVALTAHLHDANQRRMVEAQVSEMPDAGTLQYDTK